MMVAALHRVLRVTPQRLHPLKAIVVVLAVEAVLAVQAVAQLAGPHQLLLSLDLVLVMAAAVAAGLGAKIPDQIMLLPAV
jgi:hypothetical protein